MQFVMTTLRLKENESKKVQIGDGFFKHKVLADSTVQF